MGKSEASSSGSTLGGFLLGSAATATVILLYQNRKNFLSLYLELLEEYDEKEDTKASGSTNTQRGIGLELPANMLASRAMIRNEDERTGCFMSDIMKQLWPYINIAGSNSIRDIAEPMFKEMMPGPLSTLHFTKIDLGTVPIRLDNLVIHDVDMDNNTLQFDMDIVWDGNCDIKLKADYIGSFGVKSIKMRGRLAILMRPLVPTTSVVSGIQYGFINTPEISLKYSGLAHLADFKMIDHKIQEILQSVMNGMMVLPMRQLYKMDKGCDFTKIYKPPFGVARINVIGGRGFVVEKGFFLDDIPDCYCVVNLGGASHRTTTLMDNLTPEWNETMDFLLNDNDQIIQLQCWDEDEGPMDADDDLGVSATTPGEIILNGHTLELPLQQDDKPNGVCVTLGCEVLNFTTNLASLSDTDGKHMCGLLTILVLRAFDIPLEKEQAATFVSVSCGSSQFATAAVVDYPGVDSLNPWYDQAFLVDLTPARIQDGKVPTVKFQLINGVATELGSLILTHDDIVAALDNTVSGTRSIGNKGAKIQFQVCLQGIEAKEPQQPETLTSDSIDESDVWSDVAHDLEIAGAPKSALRGSPRSPLAIVVNPSESEIPQSTSRDINISVSTENEESESEMFEDATGGQSIVRITVVNGKGFAIRKKPWFMPDDIPDVYMKITFGSSPQVWRTKTVQDNQFPVWNESKDYPLTGHNQVVSIQVYEDDDKKNEDPYYGDVRVTVDKVLLAGGIVQQEILSEGRGIGSFITIKCQLV